MEEATFVEDAHGGEALLPTRRAGGGQRGSNLPLLNVRTQEEQIAANMRQERMFATLMAALEYWC